MIGAAARGPVEQLLRLMFPDYAERIRPPVPEPFADRAAGFFEYLRRERGLSEATVGRYEHVLRRFERFLARIELQELRALCAPVISAFIAEASTRLGKRTVLATPSVLRSFLDFLYRERFIDTDLGRTVEAPRRYRLADVPRSITWAQVQRLLASVDRRSSVGKRDYALLLLMVTYGLRAREVAALTLDCVDWKRERLLVAERKAGHTSVYPLSAAVGQAIIDYLRFARPETASRALFFRAMAPYQPIAYSGAT